MLNSSYTVSRTQPFEIQNFDVVCRRWEKFPCMRSLSRSCWIFWLCQSCVAGCGLICSWAVVPITWKWIFDWYMSSIWMTPCITWPKFWTISCNYRSSFCCFTPHKDSFLCECKVCRNLSVCVSICMFTEGTVCL